MTGKIDPTTIPADVDAMVSQAHARHRLRTHNLSGKPYSAYLMGCELVIEERTRDKGENDATREARPSDAGALLSLAVAQSKGKVPDLDGWLERRASEVVEWLRDQGVVEPTPLPEDDTGLLLDPGMPAQQLRLHFGEMTAQEVRTARAAIRFANSRIEKALARMQAAPGETPGSSR